MSVGVVLCVAGKELLAKHVMKGVLPSPGTDPFAVSPY